MNTLCLSKSDCSGNRNQCEFIGMLSEMTVLANKINIKLEECYQN